MTKSVFAATTLVLASVLLLFSMFWSKQGPFEFLANPIPSTDHTLFWGGHPRMMPPSTTQARITYLFPDSITAGEAFILQSTVEFQSDHHPSFGSLEIGIEIAGATIEPSTPQAVDSEGNALWSIVLSNQGTHQGFGKLRVRSSSFAQSDPSTELMDKLFLGSGPIDLRGSL